MKSPHFLSAIGLVVFITLAFGSSDTKKSPSSSQPTGATDRRSEPQRSTAEDVRITAANLFTNRYANSKLAGWNVRARAAGPDCSLLVIQIDVNMEDSMIEAMHHGWGAYAVYEGGVEHFYRERTFRGVAYRDASGRTWAYGYASADEATSVPCH